jgi:hypothetical protein
VVRSLMLCLLALLAFAPESRAYMVENSRQEKNPGNLENAVCFVPQLIETAPDEGCAYGETAAGRPLWTKFDPEGLFAGTPLDAGEWFGAVFSGAGSGLYDNTVGAAVQGYHSGERHMEGGFSEIANAHSGLDVTIGVLGIVAATGDATGAVMAVTPEGKVEKVAAEGVEKVVAEKVEQKAAGVVESSAKADAEKVNNKIAGTQRSARMSKAT